MKIVHVSTPLSWRGGEQQIAYLIQELRKKEGVEQVLVCPPNSEMEQWAIRENAHYFTFKKHSGFDLRFAKKMAGLIKREKAGIIHLHDSHAHTFGVLAAIFYGIKTPMILSRRVDFDIGKTTLGKIKYNHTAIKRILCVSNAIAEIVKKGVKDPSKVCTVHSGINTQRFKSENPANLKQEFNLSKDAKIIGNVAALADHKDHFTFIKTAEILVRSNPNWHFCIAGSGPMETEIKSVARESAAAGNIHFLGFRKNIGAILKAFDLFLFTSKTEGLGTSILDAMSCGIPVVATRAGGVPEIIKHNYNGLLSEVMDTEQLAQNVEKMLSGGKLRNRCVANACQTLFEFDTASNAEKTFGHYQELTGVHKQVLKENRY